MTTHLFCFAFGVLLGVYSTAILSIYRDELARRRERFYRYLALQIAPYLPKPGSVVDGRWTPPKRRKSKRHHKLAICHDETTAHSKTVLLTAENLVK